MNRTKKQIALSIKKSRHIVGSFIGRALENRDFVKTWGGETKAIYLIAIPHFHRPQQGTRVSVIYYRYKNQVLPHFFTI